MSLLKYFSKKRKMPDDEEESQTPCMEDRKAEAGRSGAEFQRSDKVEVPMEDREGEAGRSSAELQGGGAVRKVPGLARSLAEMKKAQRLRGGAWRCASVAWSWGACRIGLLALILTIGGLLLLALLLLLLALIAASVMGLLFMFQDTVLYRPPRLSVPVPASIPHESVFVHAQDGIRLNLVLLRHAPGPSPAPGPAPTVIYFHGNGENIGVCVYYAQRMRVDLKVNVVVLDYRGYGQSEGEPSEEGLRLDAEAALDYVVNGTDLNKTKVVLLGRSLGGAVAVRLASENPHRVAALVLENTFLSIPHVAATFFLPLGHLPLWCYKNKFLSYQHVAQCHMPTLFLSGLSDRLIPPEMMKRLYELSPSRSKHMAVFPNGTHNYTWLRPGYLAALKQFIKDLLMSHAHQEAAEGAANITI